MTADRDHGGTPEDAGFRAGEHDHAAFAMDDDFPNGGLAGIEDVLNGLED